MARIRNHDARAAATSLVERAESGGRSGRVEDEDAAARREYTEDQDETLHTFDLREWRRWRARRAAILAAARCGPGAVAALLAEGPGSADDVIERDEPSPNNARPPMPVGGLAARAMAALKGSGVQPRHHRIADDCPRQGE